MAKRIQGGPAKPIIETNTGKVRGGSAQPAYIIQPGDGYKIEGGPAQPVKVITDPNYPKQVGGDPIPVSIQASGSRKMVGGPALPIYYINAPNHNNEIPYILDFSSIPNGAMPSRFTGGTWVVQNGIAYNVPNYTEEMHANGFETDFGGFWGPTAGDGACVIDTNFPHTGLKCVKLTSGPTLNTSCSQWPAAAAGSKVLMSFWAKGDGVNSIRFMLYDLTNSATLWLPSIPTNSSYALVQKIIPLPFNCVAQFVQVYGPLANGGYTYFDDFSLKAFLPTQLLSLSNFYQTLVTVKAKWSITSGLAFSGVVACADAIGSPTSYVYAYTDGIKAYMAKVVAGTLSADLISAAITYVDGADIEIRHTASTTFQLWYNGIQVGADQTINDASIVSNTIHGLYSAGESGTSHCHLFTCNVIETRSIVFLGGSITQGSWASDAAHRYANVVMEYLKTYRSQYTYTWYNAGIGGTGSWWALFRYLTDVSAYNPDVLSIDFSVNDLNRGSSTGAAEALIRKLWTAFPNLRICVIHFLDVAGLPGTDPTNILSSVKQIWINLSDHYGFPMVDFAAGVYDLVIHGEPLSNFLHDNVHPTNQGHGYAASLHWPNVADMLSPSSHPSLPARLYSWSAEYENTPTIRNGTDNDGETGAGWSTVGVTGRQSSTPGDTIKWTAICQSFGIDGNGGAGAGVITYKTNIGQPEITIDLATSGLAQLQAMWDGTGFRGSHTITIKVVSGTVLIKRFLAI